jgi:hypothetical protein
MGRLVELSRRLVILAREQAPSEVDQWELAELKPPSESGLLPGLELPSKVRGSPIELLGLEPPPEVRGIPVGLSVLGPVAVSVIYW